MDSEEWIVESRGINHRERREHILLCQRLRRDREGERRRLRRSVQSSVISVQ